MSIRNMLKNILRTFGLECRADSVEVTGTIDVTGTLKLDGTTVTAPAVQINTIPNVLAEGLVLSTTAGRLFVCTMTQAADGVTYTAALAIPAGFTVIEVGFYSDVLWGAGQGHATTLDVGDASDPDGYLNNADLMTDYGYSTLSEETEVGAYGSSPKAYAQARTISFVVTQTGDGTGGKTMGYARAIATTSVVVATKQT